MNKRAVIVVIALLVGLVGGPALLLAPERHAAAATWTVLLLAFCGAGAAVPVGLAALASQGLYKAMVRAWSLIGLLAIVLLAAGASTLALALAGFGEAPGALLPATLGAGLVAGLGIVKLSIRRGRSKAGG